MNLSKSLLIIAAFIFTISCDTNNTNDEIATPESYEFTRDGQSTVSFSGQTTRIKMATELSVAMTDFDNSTEELLLEMYRNQTANGGDANPYSDPDLNAATKSVKSKVAASTDFYSSNTATSVELKNQFETWISAQVNEVFPNQNVEAQPGIAGQIADGTSTRYVSAKGFEYNQMLAKGLIGALMTDQILNNYVSVSVLDAGTNVEDNNNEVVVDGTAYTNMEHNWDEAFGYLYGNSSNTANPNLTIGQDDSFLNAYVGSVESDEDFAGIAQIIFDAFALGRAAIVEGDYELRDEQAEILRTQISTIIGIRAVYYLQLGKTVLEQANPDFGTAFSDLSEGFGFVYSLQFTRQPGTGQPYFTKAEVDGFISLLEAGNGLWDVTPQTLQDISVDIASKFNFTIEEASN
ncbi:MAG: DUF4856 domain-containing protein [Balneola sp.]|nr:DUF4856 domain-containing protein [Balneola sp.]MBO6650052.1 DUF4856 domain-containing protein [Balneola sp.]MBO6711598.1 DUF4856 domain-containing protein [Balneola sp.]MBO6799794.1 DUF4856 domain-containing protein [Balneola sp.]MBO6870765.1 DUF4856 domain-containing protein [Balneola sp.]